MDSYYVVDIEECINSGEYSVDEIRNNLLNNQKLGYQILVFTDKNEEFMANYMKERDLPYNTIKILKKS